MSRRPVPFALAAAGSVVLLAVVRLVAFNLAAGRWADANALRGFVELRRPLVDPLANAVAHLADPAPFVLFGGVLTLVALVRRRPRSALAVPIVLAGANLTTQLLKPALAAPRHDAWSELHGHIGFASWPSGHATASMSLALCTVLVAPTRWRPLVATLATAYAVAVCFALLALSWHYPSDVLGGYLVAGAWALSAVSLLAAADRRWPPRSGRQVAARVRDVWAAPAAASTLAALAGLALVLARPRAVHDYVAEHTTFVVGAAGIAVLGALLVVGLAAALRR